MIDWNIQLVLGISAITWHYSLLCGFISDDHAVIERRKDIIPEGEKTPKKENHWLKVLNDGPVMYYLNKALWAVFGQTPFGWHLFNYLLHMLNTYLFYLVAAKLIGPTAAIPATLLWTTNPMQNQIAVWCSGRPYGISTCLALVSILLWDKLYVVLPLYILATMTSLSVFFLPVLIKIMQPTAWQPTLYLIIMLCMMGWGVWKFKQRFGTGALILDRTHYRFNKRRFTNLARVYIYYAGITAFPVKMGWYHEGGFRFNSAWDGFNAWALMGYGLAAWLATKGVAGWWYLLGMLPNMNILATNSYLQDRYVYFGSMGLALVAAPYVVVHPEIFVAIIAIYASKAYTYSRHMVNDEKLYRENWRNHPRSDYGLNNLGFFLIHQNRFEEARVVIKRGIDLDNQNKLLWYNLGVTWAATGHLQTIEGKNRFLRALDCWKMALQIEPRWKKPKDDLDLLIKFLIDNKVLTQKKEEAAPGTPEVSVPVAEKK